MVRRKFRDNHNHYFHYVNCKQSIDLFNCVNEINGHKYIIIHFLYESPLEPINVSSLVNELTKLNRIVEQFNIDDSLSKEDNIGGDKKLTNKKLTKKNNKQNKVRQSKKHKVYERY